jgi:hypothetical protein
LGSTKRTLAKDAPVLPSKPWSGLLAISLLRDPYPGIVLCWRDPVSSGLPWLVQWGPNQTFMLHDNTQHETISGPNVQPRTRRKTGITNGACRRCSSSLNHLAGTNSQPRSLAPRFHTPRPVRLLDHRLASCSIGRQRRLTQKTRRLDHIRLDLSVEPGAWDPLSKGSILRCNLMP